MNQDDRYLRKPSLVGSIILTLFFGLVLGLSSSSWKIGIIYIIISPFVGLIVSYLSEIIWKNIFITLDPEAKVRQWSKSISMIFGSIWLVTIYAIPIGLLALLLVKLYILVYDE